MCCEIDEIDAVAGENVISARNASQRSAQDVLNTWKLNVAGSCHPQLATGLVG